MLRCLIVLLCIVPVAILGQENQDLETVLANTQKFVENLQSYDMQMDTQIKNQWAVGNINGRVAGLSAKKFLLDLTMVFSQMGHQNKSFIMLKFDGNNEWIYQGPTVFAGKNLQKLDLAGLLLPDRPFDAYNMMGSGLMVGEDYPQSLTSFIQLYSWKLDEDAQVDGIECIVLSGEILIEEMKKFLIRSGQYSALTPMVFNNLVNGSKTMSLFIRKTDYAPISWKISGTTGTITVLVKDLQINPQLTADTFSFPQEITTGAIDITSGVSPQLKTRLNSYYQQIKDQKN